MVMQQQQLLHISISIQSRQKVEDKQYTYRMRVIVKERYSMYFIISILVERRHDTTDVPSIRVVSDESAICFFETNRSLR
jgi:hypothetical protein